MKKLLLIILIFISNLSFSQNWIDAVSFKIADYTIYESAITGDKNIQMNSGDIYRFTEIDTNACIIQYVSIDNIFDTLTLSGYRVKTWKNEGNYYFYLNENKKEIGRKYYILRYKLIEN